MEDDQKQIETDRHRAEVFDALGHPTRIQILKVLSEGSLGFADLKKKTGFESSGHLQHHLTKLNGLIKTDEYGKCCLSDEGKDALLTVQTVENASPKKEVKEKGHWHVRIGIKPIAFLLIALLIASTAIAVYEYNQATNLQKEVTNFNGNYAASAYYNESAYYSEFGVIPSTNVNSSFTPPISMYRALQIGLDSQGWNETSLKGKSVIAYLVNWELLTNNTAGTYPAYAAIGSVGPTPPENYSNTYGNGVVYGYCWLIEVWNSIEMPTADSGILGYSLVDATTGQILPTGLIVFS
jgi:DNA-binding transcriptional ArsR family regulator